MFQNRCPGPCTGGTRFIRTRLIQKFPKFSQIHTSPSAVLFRVLHLTNGESRGSLQNLGSVPFVHFATKGLLLKLSIVWFRPLFPEMFAVGEGFRVVVQLSLLSFKKDPRSRDLRRRRHGQERNQGNHKSARLAAIFAAHRFHACSNKQWRLSDPHAS